MNALPDLRIRNRLGTSGLVEVFSAYDSRLSRQVAIKQIRASQASSRARDESLRLGALARIRHRNLVQVYDIIRSRDDGSIIMVMEYVAGRTLAGLVADGPLGLALALSTGRVIAEVLAAIHARGLFHGDLRADNVLITPEGEVKILLGMGLRTGSSRGGEKAEERLSILSPEQAQGLPPDARSDFFALGAVLYELATGLSPFEDLDPQVAEEKIRTLVQVPAIEIHPALPATLSDLIEELLKKRPQDRPASALEVERRLRAIADLSLDLVEESPGTEQELLAPAGSFEVMFSSGSRRHSIRREQGAQELNPRYLFETFVVGKSNEFAHAAARAVAEATSPTYNPLFLYGGVGLGKTHLLHAIGNHIQQRAPNLRVLYLVAEQFANELIDAIRFDGIPEFRERYRTVDLLLIDDIQFVAAAGERTQEQFFHTFNTLYTSQKQIVLASDRSPRDLRLLEERLRSRFEWGLIADIQPPDFETKVALLHRRANAEGMSLPEEVARFIAGQVRSNIRELEGCLNRVFAFSLLTGRPVSRNLAVETLREILPRKGEAQARRRNPSSPDADAIAALYEELRRLTAQAPDQPGAASAISERLGKLRELQQQEALAWQERFEASLGLKPGTGLAALEEAKRLLATDENPTSDHEPTLRQN